MTAVLTASGIAPAQLTLEITETAAMDHPEQGIKTLETLRALGVRLALDDFGTGYSSLAYLQRLPVDTLKIDRSFFVDTPENRTIVRVITDLAHGLGLKVTAEGLETAEQVAWARAAQCNYGQGFYFARPLTAEQAEAWWAAGLRFDLPTGQAAPPQDPRAVATAPLAPSIIGGRA